MNKEIDGIRIKRNFEEILGEFFKVKEVRIQEKKTYRLTIDIEEKDE